MSVVIGAGAVTSHYAKSFASVHGIDVSPSMLLALSSRLPPRTTYALHALSPDSRDEFQSGKRMFSPTTDDQERKLQPPRATFDVAVANWVVHHVSDVDGFMIGAKGLIRPAGWLVLTDFGRGEGQRDVVEEYRAEKRKESEEAMVSDASPYTDGHYSGRPVHQELTQSM